jgi:hypothetical protein
LCSSAGQLSSKLIELNSGPGHCHEALAVRGYVEQRRWLVCEIYLEEAPERLGKDGVEKISIELIVPTHGPCVSLSLDSVNHPKGLFH